MTDRFCIRNLLGRGILEAEPAACPEPGGVDQQASFNAHDIRGASVHLEKDGRISYRAHKSV